ncbi:MAG TPA: TonB-dependent receptor [Povalibacter sp.]|uniref:TonB-dependent receptor plug domain-containing protein n=1 Tax=Povalibacter sp. TaxID=1962978 RepID=UPI002CA2E0AE|nr:TonB-dependent receptor [Povalibacter sp.]HMN43014.1 TonB-dependent receptor [Povalibacter sp.]
MKLGIDLQTQPSIISFSRRALPLLGAGLLCVATSVHASSALLASSERLKQLSVEELLALEVTSVSRTPESLAEAAAAIRVITRDEITRSGATSIPEALRLAPNLQVAQANASQWAISARGFNNVLANKLLVMIDGRTVYTPLYAGVFWDVQDTLLEDVDRIEIVRGPGGTLWGANAVNGVINITTRTAAQTQGLFVEADVGTELRALGGIRYGGELSPDLHYRVYAKAFDRDDTRLVDGASAADGWDSRQGGFRMDWEREATTLTLQSDLYSTRPDPDGNAPVDADGGNVLGRWQHVVSDTSDFQLQVYFDRTRRDFGNGFAEKLDTYDLDWQHRFQLSPRQQIVWGLGARRMHHEVRNLPLFQFRPPDETLDLYSVFVQDEITVIPERLRLTLGTKIEHNDYTGYEHQPSGRLSWTPSPRQTIWGAISRASRTPARIDRDFYLNLTPQIGLIAGGDFQSEDLLAYEIGWRLQPGAGLSLSLSGFYNEYDNLRSVEPGPPPLFVPLTFGNGVRGETYGIEAAATYEVTDAWRLRGGYTFFDKHLSVKPGSQDLNDASVESNDPQNQVVIQSLVDLTSALQLDAVVRYVDALPDPHVPSYVAVDLRVAWNLGRQVELSLVGQNLFAERHLEFVPSSPSAREIERSVYGRIAWRL